MNEKLIERKLREKVKELGGLAIKFFAPSFTGLPDRIILMPGARISFAEIKSTGKTRSPRQRIVHRQLAALGFPVWTIDSELLLNEFLESIQR